MSTISLAVYEIVIYKKNGSVKNGENISDYNNGCDLITLFKNLPSYLSVGSSNVAVVDIEDSKKRLRINSKEFKPFGRCISGEIETGDYGVENKIVDKEGNDAGTKNKDHAAMFPFYFLCDLEKNSTRSILLLQRFSQYGIYTILSTILKKEFEKQNPNYTIRISPLVSKKAIDAIIKGGTIKKISFKTANPAQITHSVNTKNPSDYFNPSDVYCEYNIIAKRNKKVSLMNSITKLIGVDAKVSDYVTFKEFDYNEVKVVFDLNGKNQTINLAHWQRFSPDIDITDKVRINSSGFPENVDVQKAALELLDDIKEEMKK